MLRSNTVTFIGHIAGWLIFLSLPILFFSGTWGNSTAATLLSSAPYWIFIFCYGFLFYFHSYVLLPWLYFGKKQKLYYLVMAVLFISISIIKPFDGLITTMPRPNGSRPNAEMKPPGQGPPPQRDNRPQRQNPPPGPRRIDLTSMFLFITVFAISLASEITRQLRLTEQRATQAEADKANAELSFLKAQINPHFLFNTLNNIYTLAVTKNEHTAASIMKLSNIMRYVTDDASLDFVSLEDEISCIRDYIDLQRLRLGSKVEVDFITEGRPENKKIAPLVLMTFIENVFKYGISNHQPSAILISIQADDSSIRFLSQNHIFENRSTARTGIGIANTRQRLQHLYPGRHELVLSTENNIFTVRLSLLT